MAEGRLKAVEGELDLIKKQLDVENDNLNKCKKFLPKEDLI